MNAPYNKADSGSLILFCVIIAGVFCYFLAWTTTSTMSVADRSAIFQAITGPVTFLVVIIQTMISFQQSAISKAQTRLSASLAKHDLIDRNFRRLERLGLLKSSASVSVKIMLDEDIWAVVLMVKNTNNSSRLGRFVLHIGMYGDDIFELAKRFQPKHFGSILHKDNLGNSIGVSMTFQLFSVMKDNAPYMIHIRDGEMSRFIETVGPYPNEISTANILVEEIRTLEDSTTIRYNITDGGNILFDPTFGELSAL